MSCRLNCRFVTSDEMAHMFERNKERVDRSPVNLMIGKNLTTEMLVDEFTYLDRDDDGHVSVKGEAVMSRVRSASC